MASSALIEPSNEHRMKLKLSVTQNKNTEQIGLFVQYLLVYECKMNENLKEQTRSLLECKILLLQPHESTGS